MFQFRELIGKENVWYNRRTHFGWNKIYNTRQANCGLVEMLALFDRGARRWEEQRRL